MCDYVFRGMSVGVKNPNEFPVDMFKRVLNEIISLQSRYNKIKIEDRKVDEKIYVMENILEIHLEELIRRNFNSLFPNLEIIDNDQHYYTSSGNYIDILCRNKKKGEYVVIELKRDRSPSSAFIQLLDYMNQISQELDAQKTKGILVCRKIDKRMLSAIEGLKSRLNDPEDIILKEFDINLKIKNLS